MANIDARKPTEEVLPLQEISNLLTNDKNQVTWWYPKRINHLYTWSAESIISVSGFRI
jgi:hypothetical protein